MEQGPEPTDRRAEVGNLEVVDHGPLGYTDPRVFTAPLRPLTRETTLGYQVIEFAERIGLPLLPWQQWVAIHALELLPDGRPRFRTVVVLVARQNGKSVLSQVLSLWRLYARGAKLVLGAAQNLDIAREHWLACADLAASVPALKAELVEVRKANGQEAIVLASSGRYKISATTRSAGRGLSVDHLTMDEIREQRDWAGWSALSKTTMARPDAQIWCLSNAGDDESIVLNHLMEAGRSGRDPSIGVFEYSAAEGCELDEREGWRHANPALGITISETAIRSAMATDPPAVFRTEVLCQRVEQLDGAVDLAAWKSCSDPAGSLANHRDRLVLSVDVAPDGQHVAAVMAGELPDGRVRVESVGAWKSVPEALTALRDAVPRINPVRAVWFPSGPAAAIGPDLRKLFDEDQIEELKGADVSEACMALAELVSSRRLVHPGDPLLDAHISGARKLRSGDGWRFTRRAAGQVDAAYALAGAVHGLRTLPVEAPVLEPIVIGMWS